MLTGKCTWARQCKPRTRAGGTPLLAAIRRHGTAAFAVTDLCERDSQAKINAAERRYIRELDSDNPAKGYNVKQAGGGGGGRPRKQFPHSELNPDHKQKISASLIAYYQSRKAPQPIATAAAL